MTSRLACPSGALTAQAPGLRFRLPRLGRQPPGGAQLVAKLPGKHRLHDDVDVLDRDAGDERDGLAVHVDGHEVIVVPGLDEDGQVDLEALDDALRTQAERSLAL